MLSASITLIPTQASLVIEEGDLGKFRRLVYQVGYGSETKLDANIYAPRSTCLNVSASGEDECPLPDEGTIGFLEYREKLSLVRYDVQVSPAAFQALLHAHLSKVVPSSVELEIRGLKHRGDVAYWERPEHGALPIIAVRFDVDVKAQ